MVETAVVGVPHERWGEAGLAFVVAREQVGAEALLRFCRERLARYKTPSEVRFVGALPRSAAGKVLKNELRAGRASRA